MEEMNNQVMENTVTEIVEEATNKISFKENLMAYGLASVFCIGVVTTGYLGYKGVKALRNKIKDNIKGKMVDDSSEEVVDVEEDEIHDIKDDDTEQE